MIHVECQACDGQGEVEVWCTDFEEYTYQECECCNGYGYVEEEEE